MLDPDAFPFCSAFYVVEKSIDLVVMIKGDSTWVRIDALHDLKQERYRTRVYIKKSIFLEPAYPADQEAGRQEPVEIWSDWIGAPSSVGKSADEVLESTLSFLRECCVGGLLAPESPTRLS
jgi:hypothetical protein